MRGPLALSHFIELNEWLVRHAHKGKHIYVKSFDLSFQSATIVILTCMCVLDKRSTLWLRYTFRQTFLGKSVIGGTNATYIILDKLTWKYLLKIYVKMTSLVTMKL